MSASDEIQEWKLSFYGGRNVLLLNGRVGPRTPHLFTHFLSGIWQLDWCIRNAAFQMRRAVIADRLRVLVRIPELKTRLLQRVFAQYDEASIGFIGTEHGAPLSERRNEPRNRLQFCDVDIVSFNFQHHEIVER